MQKDLLTAAVIGAGTMGTTLAKLMASKGLKVIVVDNNKNVLEASKFSIGEESANIIFTQELKTDHKLDFLIESVTENVDIKRKVLAQIESKVSESTIIMTNTSGIPIDDIASDMRVPQRFLGAHFFNPANIIPVVEVVPGTHTDPLLLEMACQYLKKLGKRPVVLNTCVPGFIANRIQHAIVRECLSLLEKGVINAEALDEVVQYSVGVRMALNGPLFQRDLNGLDTHLHIARYLYPDLEASKKPAKTLEDYVKQGRLGAKAGQGFYNWSDTSRVQYQAKEQENLQRIIKIAMENQYQEES